MGPALMTGLACFGAAVGIGLLVSGTWRSVAGTADQVARRARGLALILMAFGQGIAVMGVVVGLLDIFLGPTRNPSDGLLAAVPAVAGSLIGLGLIVRHLPSGDRQFSAIAALYVVALAVLAIVVALLGYFIDETGTGNLADWPFAILGLISGTSAMAIGWTAASRIRAMQGADEATAKSITAAAISRAAIFQAAAVASSVVAIALIIIR